MWIFHCGFSVLVVVISQVTGILRMRIEIEKNEYYSAFLWRKRVYSFVSFTEFDCDLFIDCSMNSRIWFRIRIQNKVLNEENSIKEETDTRQTKLGDISYQRGPIITVVGNQDHLD